MKKMVRKLVLSKETLRSLDVELRQIVGGETDFGCIISNRISCGCTDTCTGTSPSVRVVCR